MISVGATQHSVVVTKCKDQHDRQAQLAVAWRRRRQTLDVQRVTLMVRDIEGGGSRVGMMVTGEARSMTNSLSRGVRQPFWAGDATVCLLPTAPRDKCCAVASSWPPTASLPPWKCRPCACRAARAASSGLSVAMSCCCLFAFGSAPSLPLTHSHTLTHVHQLIQPLSFLDLRSLYCF
jgi:hypothetical protein